LAFNSSLCYTTSQQMFKMSPVCTHARCQSLPPLADGQVNEVLLHTVPDVVETLLQLIGISDSWFIHPLLHDAPDLVVDGIQVWTVGGGQRSGPMKSGVSLCGNWMVSWAQCAGALSCWKTNESPATCFNGWNHLLRQQDIAVVGLLAINFNSGVDKHQLSHTHFWHGNRPHNGLAECRARA